MMPIESLALKQIFLLREQGKEKVHEDDISDQHDFFWCLQEIWEYFCVGMCFDF